MGNVIRVFIFDGLVEFIMCVLVFVDEMLEKLCLGGNWYLVVFRVL